MFLIVSLLFSLCFAVNADCPSGSVTSYTNKTICYTFNATKASYVDAEATCNSYGGHLVTIRNLYENLFMAENAQSFLGSATEFWTGANDLLSHGTWAWIDGTVMSFTDWDSKQPKNTSGYDCGAMKISTGKWITDDCYSKTKAFACAFIGNAGTTTQIATMKASTTTTRPRTTPSSSGCPSGWSYFNVTKACYQVVNTTQSWQASETACQSFGGHLVSIHSFAENNFVGSLASNYQYAWIGFSYNTSMANFTWVDSSKFDYVIWDAGYPSLPDTYPCGTMYLNPSDSNLLKTWFNWSCSVDLSFTWSYVCKKIIG